jgi:regulator of sigma E protease
LLTEEERRLTAETILLTVLMFFVLVGCHEFGHLYFAKRAGILVREYAIGFGPKVFSYRKGETRYTFRLLPLGGFVRMAGEDPEVVDVQKGQTLAVHIHEGKVTKIFLDQLDTRRNALRGTVEDIDLEHRLHLKLDVDGELQSMPIHPEAIMVGRGKETQIAPWNRQFGSKTVAQRSLAIFAGPMMNFILAFILFLTFIFMSGVPVENPTHIELNHISKAYPAEEAGLQKGDIVYSVNDIVIGTDRELLISTIQKSPDKTMNWVILREGEKQEITITPRKEERIGIVGVGVAYPKRAPHIGEALHQAGVTMVNAAEQILIGLKMLITLQFDMDDLGGPVRITEVTGEAVSQGMNIYVFWAGLLSLYLGIFNLLPFPALDGSRLVFLGIEGLRGRPVDPHRESMVHFIGFAMLMLLMIAVTYNDILRLFKN